MSGQLFAVLRYGEDDPIYLFTDGEQAALFAHLTGGELTDEPILEGQDAEDVIAAAREMFG
jgi:hypothetical protein